MTTAARLHTSMFLVLTSMVAACGGTETSDPATGTIEAPTSTETAATTAATATTPSVTAAPSAIDAPPAGSASATPLASASTGALDPFVGCKVDADCGWGEIGHEITQRTDCGCLFGCPSVALNTATLKRRDAQYKALCSPGRSGDGGVCPIDDCAPAPPATCRKGVCVGR